jgi:hypothetical protein
MTKKSIVFLIILVLCRSKYCRADKEYPVPVLTAIGELDGGGLSYLRREWEETAALPQDKRLLTKTILVPQVSPRSLKAYIGDFNARS